MSAGPDSHVKDKPYFAISKDGEIIFPKISTDEHHHLHVEWPKEVLWQDSFPALVTVHGVSILVVSILLLVGAFKALAGIKAKPDENRGVTAQLFEVLIKFVRDDIAKPNLGKEGMKYLPLMLTFFFFILFSNLWGMVPILVTGSPTGNINVTASLAIIVLSSMFILGIKEQGLIPFVKNIVPHGIPGPVLILLYPIELIGPLTKAFALSIRLFANMAAGHIVLAAFAGLGVSVTGEINWVGIFPAFIMSVGISLLEVFVAFLQAYIFTLLSSVFIGSFVHPDH
jgi:F-type H+-transporting ATPase subunit a